MISLCFCWDSYLKWIESLVKPFLLGGSSQLISGENNHGARCNVPRRIGVVPDPQRGLNRWYICRRCDYFENRERERENTRISREVRDIPREFPKTHNRCRYGANPNNMNQKLWTKIMDFQSAGNNSLDMIAISPDSNLRCEKTNENTMPWKTCWFMTGVFSMMGDFILPKKMTKQPPEQPLHCSCNVNPRWIIMHYLPVWIRKKHRKKMNNLDCPVAGNFGGHPNDRESFEMLY